MSPQDLKGTSSQQSVVQSLQPFAGAKNWELSPRTVYLSGFSDSAASLGWISEVRIVHLKLLLEALLCFFPHPERNHKYLQGPTKLADSLAGA